MLLNFDTVVKISEHYLVVNRGKTKSVHYDSMPLLRSNIPDHVSRRINLSLYSRELYYKLMGLDLWFLMISHNKTNNSHFVYMQTVT